MGILDVKYRELSEYDPFKDHPHLAEGSGQAEYFGYIIEYATEFYNSGKWHLNGVDEEVRVYQTLNHKPLNLRLYALLIQKYPNNYAHDAIPALIHGLFYSKNSLAADFPDDFKGCVPTNCVVIALTYVSVLLA